MQQSRTVVRIRWTEFDHVTAARGWENDAERARQFGISEPTFSLMRAGKRNAGEKVIHRIMKRLDEPYLALFEEITVEQAAA